MKKKLFLLTIILYLLGGVWFYSAVIKNPNAMVEICPQNAINIEASPEGCKPQKFTLQEAYLGSFYAITLWLPMIIGKGLGGN
ncbi:MAG: hypothetical protein Q8P10_03130 [bacterium]|nr:hypothetical protein [bacterium]